jgi:P27 family predicted phage terminase small subunit
MYKPDKNLHKKAKAYMREVVKSLENQGRLQDIDDASLEILAYNYDIFLRASERLNGEYTVIGKDGQRVKNPLMAVIDRAVVTINTCTKQFGLSALDRAKLNKIDKTEKDDSVLAQLLAEN